MSNELDFKTAFDEIYNDLRGCIAASQSIGLVTLPDGRRAEVQIIITTEEDDWLDTQNED